MKTLLSIFAMLVLAGCNPSPQATVIVKEVVAEPKHEGCILDTNSNLVTQHVVGPITNLVKETKVGGMDSQCTVKFDISVNDRVYHLEETYIGWEQTEALCYFAREQARKNLLLDLGGEFKSEASISCRNTELNG